MLVPSLVRCTTQAVHLSLESASGRQAGCLASVKSIPRPHVASHSVPANLWRNLLIAWHFASLLSSEVIQSLALRCVVQLAKAILNTDTAPFSHLASVGDRQINRKLTDVIINTATGIIPSYIRLVMSSHIVLAITKIESHSKVCWHSTIARCPRFGARLVECRCSGISFSYIVATLDDYAPVCARCESLTIWHIRRRWQVLSSPAASRECRSACISAFLGSATPQPLEWSSQGLHEKMNMLVASATTVSKATSKAWWISGIRLCVLLDDASLSGRLVVRQLIQGRRLLCAADTLGTVHSQAR